MRVYGRFALPLVWLLAAAGGMADAQSPTPPGVPQTPYSSRDQPARPPAKAPHQPVNKSGEAASAQKTQVVLPLGSLHPQKSVGGAVSGKAVPVQVAPPPIVPAPSPAEAATAAPEKLPDPEKPEGAAPKLPRFASLRSDDVNMRAGPGTRYRIDWVYKRRELPVEIQREFDVWRWVRDADGVQGWVHQATLMGRRGFVVQKSDATLRSAADPSASAVAILRPGVIGRIRSCEASSDWCDVQAGAYRGYLRRDQFWGVLPGEAVNP
jgi:SH3-like domain-containing protein